MPLRPRGLPWVTRLLRLFLACMGEERMCACVRACVRACACVSACVQVYMRMCVCASARVCVGAGACVCRCSCAWARGLRARKCVCVCVHVRERVHVRGSGHACDTVCVGHTSLCPCIRACAFLGVCACWCVSAWCEGVEAAWLLVRPRGCGTVSGWRRSSVCALACLGVSALGSAWCCGGVASARACVRG
jgi:hypothetical protein